MKTKVKQVNRDNFSRSEFEEASEILRSGGLVAFPTETVYGLGGDGLLSSAAEKIYAAKGRPSDNPLIIHISSMDDLTQLTDEVSEKANRLADAFWPGPLTMIFQKNDKVPYGTTGGLDTVAVRMPNHPIALELIRTSGVLIAAPSANTSGRPSPTKAEHVVEDLDGKIDMIIDGGEVGIGIESTIVDLTSEIPTILRPGYITKEMLEEVIGEVAIDQAILTKGVKDGLKPKAPGMKYKHYAPKGDLTLYKGLQSEVVDEINKDAAKKRAQNYKVGVIATEETKEMYDADYVMCIGSRNDEESIARHLYGILREFDHLEVKYIYGECFSKNNLGQAIMNRLLKAAGYHVVDVSGRERCDKDEI
ncbi:L-threonylcarbamoyladenylate synthase [[Clostridium] polysaccharolyticum]|uniref:Threonylcarbamoyl-AMP synthase n=1 Tax=[Clostridium] polysaccharolyticum TaxID=29364 RepID=A0A1I0BS99_9FIRM|nr:L-threonylcarbamoyladenylate synthase [[Clostridium] polysaccharolyticum]SET09178.1 L-threonylcarbamoyladenylate synthase [[Clostridium] polysaccharolyticum]